MATGCVRTSWDDAHFWEGRAHAEPLAQSRALWAHAVNGAQQYALLAAVAGRRAQPHPARTQVVAAIALELLVEEHQRRLVALDYLQQQADASCDTSIARQCVASGPESRAGGTSDRHRCHMQLAERIQSPQDIHRALQAPKVAAASLGLAALSSAWYVYSGFRS